MTESTMFADLLAAQKAMPHLQKSAINPHFKNRYVPLEELLQAVIPVLNEHNFVLMQLPAVCDGQPALDYIIQHRSGEVISGRMLLCASKDDPQGQGSAITYARRYSLMALLGLTADVDDDAETTRQAPPARTQQRPAAPQTRPTPENGYPLPECPQGHGAMLLTSVKTKNGPANVYKCQDRSCKAANGYAESIWEDQWLKQVNASRGTGEAGDYDPNDIPFNE